MDMTPATNMALMRTGDKTIRRGRSTEAGRSG